MAVLKRNGYTYGGALNIDAKAGAHINEHGTPSVEANFENGKMIFTFDYLKGAEGEPGGLPDDNITGAGSVGEFAIFNGENVIGSKSLTPTDVGLSKVGNFKAVSTVANQGLTTTEKSNARTNIGAGTSNFDGNYNNLSNKPSLATVATSGNYNDLTNKPSFGTAASKNYTNSYSSTGTDLVTGQAVSAALATLPSPMIFKGSLGSGGTISSLPTASSINTGYTYKVITAGTYAGQSAKEGDQFISDGSSWIKIPSGDEPSGTVTNVAASGDSYISVSGSPITTSGTFSLSFNTTALRKLLKQILLGGSGTTDFTSAELANIQAILNNISIKS